MFCLLCFVDSNPGLGHELLQLLPGGEAQLGECPVGLTTILLLFQQLEDRGPLPQPGLILGQLLVPLPGVNLYEALGQLLPPRLVNCSKLIKRS